MAGLAIAIDPLADPNQLHKLLHRMLDSITGEIWHVTSGQVFGSAALGRVSLEVFNPGPQPVFNEDNTLCAMIDGEIHNPQYQPLKRHLLECGHRLQSDNHAELLLHLYEEQGDDFIRDINGSFNFVIWDSQQKKLTIVNDRFGTRPAFYSTRAGFCFASEIKALLQKPELKWEVDEHAAIEFFTLRHLLGDKTPFVGIHCLPPASILTYKDRHVSLSSYWTPPFGREGERLSVQEYAEELTNLLRKALDRCLNRTHSVGILLSGGLDSRLLAGLVDQRYLPIDTFTRGMPGCDDARLGQMVADQVGTRHHFLEIASDFLIKRAEKGVFLTDGLMTAIDFYELSTIDQLKKQVDVVCFGIPAGPLGGVGLSSAFNDINDDKLAEKIYASRAVYIHDSLQPYLFSKRFYQNTNGMVLKNLRQILGEMPAAPSQVKAQSYFLSHYGPRSAMYGPVLTRSMVETCFPFADAELLEFTCKVPGEFRINRQVEIEMLKIACPKLAEIPWQFSGLPINVSTSKRIRFQRALYRARKELHWRSRGLVSLPERKEQVNWAAWFRTVLRSWLEDILLSERTLTRGYFRPEGVHQLVREHMSGRYDRSLQFGPLITFELWNRLFVDGEGL